MALDHLNVKPIVSIETPSNSTEELCARWYDQSRREALRRYPWNFAAKRIILAPDATDPVFGYSKQFTLPADFIRMKYINQSVLVRDNPIPASSYTIEDNKILIAHHYEERKGRSIKKHRIYSPPVNIRPLDFSKTEEIFERLKNNVSKTDSIEKSLKMIGASTESITYHFPEVREIIETNQINEENLNTVAKKVNQLWSCGFTSKYIKNLLEELKNDLMKHIVEDIQFKSSETSEKKDALELEKIIRAQKQRITECKDDITKINKIIEYLTENYDVFESLLKDIKKDPGKKEIYEEKLNCKIDINYPKLKIKFL